ncbi:MAG: TIGR01777 family oxidoreductase [Bacteroidota bacterium]|nr:TIGR01777 family oxidoreductase [Bacteroidota bacterium]
MKILITGGTGFIGTHLLHQLTKTSNDIVLLTRSAPSRHVFHTANVRCVQWDAKTFGVWTEELLDADVVINLIGKNIFEQRWNKKVKRELAESRVHATQLLVEAMRQHKHKPHVFVSVSAVGYYGDTGEEPVIETSPAGKDFLAQLVLAWETAALKAELDGVRVALPRVGIVLHNNSDIIQRLLLPFRMFVGGWIGSGKQYMSWIHADDVVRGILFAIENTQVAGAFNLVSPQPVQSKEFSRIFGKILHRPSWIPVPTILLKIFFGEVSEVITTGQKVVPQKLLRFGFQFSFPTLESALRQILS